MNNWDVYEPICLGRLSVEATTLCRDDPLRVALVYNEVIVTCKVECEAFVPLPSDCCFTIPISNVYINPTTGRLPSYFGCGMGLVAGCSN